MEAGIVRGPREHSPNWINDVPVLGPEDIAVDHGARLAYVSSQDRRGSEWLIPGVLRQRSVDWTKRGRIYRVDLRNGLATEELAVRIASGADFHPAGIDLYVGPSGDRRLFVVNHRTATEFSIEVFDVVDGTLSHQATAMTNDLTLPNDIVAISEQEFYVSNCLSLPPLMQGFEKAFRLPTGNVLFHDLDIDGAKKWKRVAHGISYANGLALDRKRNRLFVAATLSSRLLAFPWNPAEPWEPLSAPETLPLEFMPDNLGWEDEDTLWSAGSEFLKSIPYTLLLSDSAPSHVVRLRLAGAGAENPFEGVRPERIYDDEGGEIAQCSVAAPYRANGEHRFMVGSCFDDHLSAFRAAA
jgi:hypothetical protein